MKKVVAKPKRSSSTVGYRNPPERTRFKPGVSGNKNGRPKGSRSFLTTLRAILREKVSVTEAGREKQMSRSEILARTVVKQAFGGKMQAIQFLAAIHDRIDEADKSDVGALTAKDDQKILDKYIGRAKRRKGGTDDALS